MSDFLVSLWESVFTPGPTPTLLRATNVTFASLQVLLFILLLSTYSYHFVILSVLSGGLWYSINWFSAELLAANKQEAAGKQGVGKKIAEQVGSDTETEQDESSQPVLVATTGAHPTGSRAERRNQASNSAATSTVSQQATSSTSSSFLDPNATSSLHESSRAKRTKSRGDSSGYVSTDSEWEKVSENEGS